MHAGHSAPCPARMGPGRDAVRRDRMVGAYFLGT